MTYTCCGPSTVISGQGSPRFWAQYLGIRIILVTVDESRKLGERPGDRKEYSLWFGAEGPGKAHRPGTLESILETGGLG